jgi:hypothetical protein
MELRILKEYGPNIVQNVILLEVYTDTRVPILLRRGWNLLPNGDYYGWKGNRPFRYATLDGKVIIP